MKVKVKLEVDGDEVVIELPNGNKVSLVLSDIEDEALPELDIMFDRTLTANLFKQGSPSVPHEDHTYASDFNQILVPLKQHSG